MAGHSENLACLGPTGGARTRRPQAFDNRTLLDRCGLSPVQRVVDGAAGRGRIHFIAEVGGVMIGYCYIRKNACTSFKRLFLEHAPSRYASEEWSRPIDFMRARMVLRPGDGARCGAMIFVYRDPTERLVSLYKNKFIVGEGQQDIFRNYSRITGKLPEESTFRRFVFDYFRRKFTELDRHVLPQALHLQRFNYTHPVPITKLYEAMTPIIGEELADSYFRRPANATPRDRIEARPGAADISARELGADFKARGTLPSNESLLDDALRERIARIYKVDMDLVASLKGRL